MKLFRVVLLAATLSSTDATHAQQLDLSTVTCKEFVESNRETIRLIMMWLAGYMAADDDPPVVDFDKMRSDGEKLSSYCARNPTVGLMTAAEEVLAEDK